jgi:hypothetical protein
VKAPILVATEQIQTFDPPARDSPVALAGAGVRVDGEDILEAPGHPAPAKARVLKAETAAADAGEQVQHAKGPHLDLVH